MGHDWKKHSYPSKEETGSVLLPPEIEWEGWICEKCGAVVTDENNQRPPTSLRVNVPGVQMPNGRSEVTCDEAVVHQIMSA